MFCEHEKKIFTIGMEFSTRTQSSQNSNTLLLYLTRLAIFSYLLLLRMIYIAVYGYFQYKRLKSASNSVVPLNAEVSFYLKYDLFDNRLFELQWSNNRRCYFF